MKVFFARILLFGFLLITNPNAEAMNSSAPPSADDGDGGAAESSGADENRPGNSATGGASPSLPGQPGGKHQSKATGDGDIAEAGEPSTGITSSTAALSSTMSDEEHKASSPDKAAILKVQQLFPGEEKLGTQPGAEEQQPNTEVPNTVVASTEAAVVSGLAQSKELSAVAQEDEGLRATGVASVQVQEGKVPQAAHTGVVIAGPTASIEQIDVYAKCFVINHLFRLYYGPAAEDLNCELLGAASEAPLQSVMDYLVAEYNKKKRKLLSENALHSWLELDLRIKALEHLRKSGTVADEYRVYVDEAIKATYKEIDHGRKQDFHEIFEKQIEFMLSHALMKRLVNEKRVALDEGFHERWTDYFPQGMINKKMMEDIIHDSKEWKTQLDNHLTLPERTEWFNKALLDIENVESERAYIYTGRACDDTVHLEYQPEGAIDDFKKALNNFKKEVDKRFLERPERSSVSNPPMATSGILSITMPKALVVLIAGGGLGFLYNKLSRRAKEAKQIEEIPNETEEILEIVPSHP